MHNSSNGNKEQDNNQKEPAILIVADMYRTRLHFQLITIIMTFQEPSVYFSIFRKEFWESSLLKKAVSLDIPWYRRDTLDSPILF